MDDNLEQMLRSAAGVIVDPDELSFRCGCALPESLLRVDLPVDELRPEAVAGPDSSSAMDAAVAMFNAFSRRAIDEYTAWFAPDFVFESTNANFHARHPHGMSLRDELSFARNLLVEAPAATGPTALPHARRIVVAWNRTRAVGPPAERSVASIVFEGLRSRIDLSDGSHYSTVAARHEMQWVRTGAGWRIRRWVEIAPNEPPPAAAAVRRGDSVAVATSAPDSARVTLPTRLDLYPIMGSSRNGLVLSVALPVAGGVLDMFDVQGRRIEHRDLSDLRPGYHRVTLDGGAFPAGVYWARLRQSAKAVTARVVWVR